MAFIKFNKAELVNLSYSLKREIISANKTGACCNTTIVACNTRRYHGLLAVPIEEFGGDKHILLSSVDDSIVVGGKQFNLGIHRYGEIYEPKGHKYIIDFQADPVPQIVYRVGEVTLSKSILLAPEKDQLMIKYEVREAPSKVDLLLKPFLAFRSVHNLTRENNQAVTSYELIENGVSFKMYEGFPTLHLQTNTSKSQFAFEPNWYKSITYLDEARRGFECTEDLFVPGCFSVSLCKGSSLILSASIQEEKTSSFVRSFNAIVKKSAEISSYKDQLKHCADLLIRDRGGRKKITSGFSWLYTGQMRSTLYSLVGLTLYANGSAQDFEEILDNLIEDNKERFYYRTNQVEAPLRLADVLQEYIRFGADPKSVWKKYGTILKKVIESYAPGNRKEVSVQPNGLLWAEKPGCALSWMDAYVDGVPVTERAGYQVETNAFWYNALCFALEMEGKYGAKRNKFIKEWMPIKELAFENFTKVFWNEDLGYLADYVDNNGQKMDVRPNMLFAIWVQNSPVDDISASSIISVINNELVTRRGLRTLSPRNSLYKGVYEGSQQERDLAYHQGSTRPYLLYQYVDVCFKMMGAAFYKKAEWLIEGFYDDLNKHGVGAFAEIYDGDPPHEPHGAISSAWSTSALLAVNYLMEKYKEVQK